MEVGGWVSSQAVSISYVRSLIARIRALFGSINIYLKASVKLYEFAGRHGVAKVRQLSGSVRILGAQHEQNRTCTWGEDLCMWTTRKEERT